ncbi:MAG: hypothetical protein ACMUIP_02950 [bacterium]
MEIEKAKEIVSSLANGIDPITGEVFPDDSPYNHPSVIRALLILLGNVGISKKKNKLSVEEKQSQNLATGKPRNAGLPWTDELRQKVATMFHEETSIPELARFFERTEGSIHSELVRQGLIDQS